jgi:hypothetical protein
MANEITNKNMLSIITEALRYMPYIYRQIKNANTGNTATRHNFYVKYKSDELDPNTILFLLPDDPGKQENILGILSPLDGYDYSEAKKYIINIEGIDGQYTPANDFNIVANRMLMIRVISKPVGNTPGNVVILNDPWKDDVDVATINVRGEASFHEPVFVKGKRLVDIDELTALQNRVQKLEEKIIVGTQDPSVALQDAADGTIYLQVDGYGNED